MSIGPMPCRSCGIDTGTLAAVNHREGGDECREIAELRAALPSKHPLGWKPRKGAPTRADLETEVAAWRALAEWSDSGVTTPDAAIALARKLKLIPEAK